MKHFKLLPIVTIVFLAAITLVNVQAQAPAGLEQDKTAIAAAVDQMVRGWNAKSGAEFAKPFAENADYVIINGIHIIGRPAIAAGHQGIFDSVYKVSTLTYKVENIRFLRPDIAVTHVYAMLNVGAGEAAQTGRARITLVMAKEKGQWHIAAFQNTSIDEGQGGR